MYAQKADGMQAYLCYFSKGEKYYTIGSTKIQRYSDNSEEAATDLMINKEHDSFEADEEKDHVEKYEIILSWLLRLMGKGLQGLISMIAGEDLSIDKLVFDQYSKTNLFIFKRDADKYGQNTLVSGALNSLNEVFSIFSKIAVTAYLIILVYMGIRMLTMSTDAGRQAKYKEMLFDWVRGLIILYFFPYVMRYTILLNHAFVTYLQEESVKVGIELQGASIKATDASIEDVIKENSSALKDASGIEEGADGDDYVATLSGGDSYMSQMYQKAEKSKRIADAMVWLIMLIQVLQFLIVYMKRLITVIFLIAIFPLVSISYAVDKIGDGKSQAFNNWTKEFILQVFIQSFHAINYVLIMGIVMQLSGDNWFLKIIGITYVAKGSDILRGLFAQMKGGAGKDGGPLSVAKAMIKTNLAISGVKAIGNVASRTIGRNSVLGHGVGMLANANNTRLERNATRAARIANEVYNDSNVPYYGDGTLKKPLDSMTQRKLEKVLEKEGTNPYLTRDEEKKAYNQNLEELSKMSPEDLERVMNQMGLNPNEQKMLNEAIFAASVHSAVRNRRGKDKTQIRKEVDMELKIRNQSEGGNSYLNRYMDTAKRELSDDKLREIAGANSVSFAARANNPVILSNAEGLSQEELTDKALVAVNYAYRNDYTKDELDYYMDVIDKAEADPELNKRVRDYERDNLSFTMDDFRKALATEVVNHSHDNDAKFERTNKAIQYLKSNIHKETDKEILSQLNANFDDLQEGVLPTLHERKNEVENMQARAKRELAGLSEIEMLGRNSPEYVEYLRNMESELTSKFRKELARGIATTTAGGVVSGFKLGTETAVAGIATGATASGKGGNILEDVITIVPNTVKMTENMLNKAGSLPSRAANAGLTGVIGDADDVSLKTTIESMKINEKYYRDQSALDNVNRKISQAEDERQRLLNKIKGEAEKRS